MTDDDTGRQAEDMGVPEHVLEGLAAHATPVPTDPDAPPRELAALNDRFADAEVVGLGEASHGSREFFEAKHRLLRRLFREHDLGAVAFEANLPEARAVDAYVRGGDGDPVAALEGLYFWTWTVDAVLDLLEWLRSYNAGRPPAEQVRFYGLDAQYTGGAVESLRAFLEAVDPDALKEVAADPALADDGGTAPHQDDRRRERAVAVDRVVPALRKRIGTREPAYAERVGADRVERARRDLRVLEQAAAHRRAVEARASAADPRPEHTERALRVRDRAMAENAAWVADRTDGPVAVWGHDAHVNRVAQRSRDTDAAAPSMGADLAARYGQRYLAVGFSAGRLGFQAMGPEADGDGYTLREFTVKGPLAGTTEAAIAAATDGPVVLDLRAGREDLRLREWLTVPRPHLSVGATFEPGEPRAYLTEYAHGDAFDLLWHLPETERAVGQWTGIRVHVDGPVRGGRPGRLPRSRVGDAREAGAGDRPGAGLLRGGVTLWNGRARPAGGRATRRSDPERRRGDVRPGAVLHDDRGAPLADARADCGTAGRAGDRPRGTCGQRGRDGGERGGRRQHGISSRSDAGVGYGRLGRRGERSVCGTGRALGRRTPRAGEERGQRGDVPAVVARVDGGLSQSVGSGHGAVLSAGVLDGRRSPADGPAVPGAGLVRKKWDDVHYADGRTYGEVTIERAIEVTDERYEPSAGGEFRGEANGSKRSTGVATTGHAEDPSDPNMDDAPDRPRAHLLKRNRLLRQRVQEQAARIDALEAALERQSADQPDGESSEDSLTVDEAEDLSLPGRAREWLFRGQ